MKFTSNVVVLSARRYSMTDEKTGELVQGTKIEYVEDWEPQPQQNKRGLSVLSANFPYELFDRLGDVPAVYSAADVVDLFPVVSQMAQDVSQIQEVLAAMLALLIVVSFLIVAMRWFT